ncbi:MAG: hypothetical protein JWL61_295 [Gemmatimonadetes bacterium]|nr:hypothetical protein [Gemmatimonadota bacterium]
MARFGPSLFEAESVSRSNRVMALVRASRRSKAAVLRSRGEVAVDLHEAEAHIRALVRNAPVFPYVEQRLIHQTTFAAFSESHPQLEVFCRRESLVEAADITEQAALDHHGWQGDVRLERDHAVENPTGVALPRLELRGRDVLPVRVDETSPGIAPSVPRIRRVEGELSLQLRRLPAVVGIEKGDPIGSCTRQPGVPEQRLVSGVLEREDNDAGVVQRSEP